MYKARKGRSTGRYEPPSPSYCSEDDEERERYFVDNPDFEFDTLPQPFRFIDKILEGLLDRLSDEIDKLEKLKELKSNINPLPTFKNPTLLDLSSIQDNASFDMKMNGNGEHLEGCTHAVVKASATRSRIYVASGKQLMAFNCFTKSCLAQIDIASNHLITILKTIPLGISDSGTAVDMIASLDDSGNCFGFLFDGKEFLPVRLFEAYKSEASSKVLHWETSSDLCFVALTKYHPGIGNSLEIYKIPLQDWLAEYESAMKKSRTDGDKVGDEDMLANESHEGKSKPANSIELIDESCEEGEKSSQQKSPHIASYLQLKTMIPIATLRPTKEIPSATYNSAKIYDGGRIGSGNRTVLNVSFYKTLRSQLRNDLSSPSTVDVSVDLVAYESTPTVHFLKVVGDSFVTENRADQKQCLYEFIGVWWSSRNQFLVYKLPKSSRDGELQFEYAYSNADLIARSCVNEDTNLIAIALQNQNVIIWNRLENEPSRVILLEEPDLLFMKFANLHGSSERLIFGMKSGSMSQLTYGTKDLSLVTLTDQSSVKQTDLLYLDIAPDHPSLLFVARKPDMITVFDLHQQSAVFNFQLPLGFDLDHSTTECFMLNSDLSALFAFASKPFEYGNELHALYMYNICIGDLWYEFSSSKVDAMDSQSFKETWPKSLESISLGLIRSIYGKKQAREERRQKRWKEYEKELLKRVSSVNDSC